MNDRSGLSRGDRNRNARLARLRRLLRPERGVVGSDHRARQIGHAGSADDAPYPEVGSFLAVTLPGQDGVPRAAVPGRQERASGNHPGEPAGVLARQAPGRVSGAARLSEPVGHGGGWCR
jgi:hypothetical protein